MRLLLFVLAVGCAPEIAPSHPPAFPPCLSGQASSSVCVDANGDTWSSCAWTYYGRFLPMLPKGNP